MGLPKEDVDLNVEWRNACEEFFKTTDMRLDGQKAQPDKIADMIRAKKAKDEKDSAKLKKFGDVVAKTVTCLQNVGGALAQVASMFFGPSDMCINAVSFFVQAAMDYKKIFTDLDELWAMISDALDRFAIYKENQGLLDAGMKAIASQILLKFIDVCRLSCKILHKNRLWQVTKTTLFRDNAGVPDVINDLVKTIDRETQTRGTYSYVSIKATERNVVEGFSQMNQGFGQTASSLSQANEGITELKGIVSQGDRDRQLQEVSKKLGKPDTNQRDNYGNYIRNALSNTGDWILKQDSYQNWVDTEQPLVLFLSGDEGCGKSFLMSSIMQKLLKKYPHGKEDMSRISVVCYFFKEADSSKKEGTLQNCTTSAALRTLAYQVAENDPLYRKSLQGLQEDSVISTSDINELWSHLFGRQDDSAKIYLLIDGIHQLESQQLIELGQILEKIITQSPGDLRIRAMVGGRPENIKDLSQKLGPSASSIDVPANNAEDIRAFVRKEVESMPLLKRSETLRTEICESLEEIAKGTFGNISLLLQQIRKRQRPSEIKKLLEEAKQSKDILDTIARQIEHCNDTLTDADIEDLNQLLEWSICAPWPITLKEYEAVLHIRKGSSSDSSLKPLYDRLQNEFSGFFSVKPDRNDPEADVFLSSDKIREYFEKLSADGQDETEVSSGGKVTQAEVDIIQRILKNLCDDILYKKFEFEEFFKQRASSASKVYVNVDDMHAKVALDCIKVIVGEIDKSTRDDAEWPIGGLFANQLEAADISYLSPKLKGEVGRRLANIFSGESVSELWEYSFIYEWIVEAKLETAVLKWFQDSAAIKGVPEDQKAWMTSLKSATDGEHDLFENVAKAAAKAWLFGKPGGQIGEAVSSPFQFLRGYWNKVRSKKDPAVKRFDTRDFFGYEIEYDDLKDLLDWAKTETGLVDLTYTPCVRVAATYELVEDHPRAEQMLHQAIALQDGGAAPKARWNLAVIYGITKRYELAIETMSKAIEESKPQSKEEHSELKQGRKFVAQWRKELSQYEEAMQIYQEMLEEEAEDYEVVGDILSLLSHRGNKQQIIELLESLGGQQDTKTGNDRLTQLLLARADDEEGHNVISQSANELGVSAKIRGDYEKAIKTAEKEEAIGTNPEGDKRLQPLEVIVYLKHSLANTLHRFGDNPEDSSKAVKLWEQVTYLPLPPSIKYRVYNPKKKSAMRLCLHYLAEARRTDPDSDTARALIEKVEDLSKYDHTDDLCSFIYDEDVNFMLGYYYTSVSNKAKAREQLKSVIELGVNLLSDEDDSNDVYGFTRLANGFMRFGDDKSALAAWSLVAPDKNLPQSAEVDEQSQPTNGSEKLESSVDGSSIRLTEPSDNARDENATPDENSNTDLEGRPPLKRSATSGVSRKPKGPWWAECGCDTCRTEWTYADDIWACKQCSEVFFTTDCHQKLLEDKLTRHFCDKSHEFLYIPAWDFDEMKTVPKNSVMVGKEVIPMKAWLERIKQDWDIKVENKEEAKSDEEGAKAAAT